MSIEKHNLKLEIMRDLVIKRWGYENPHTISFFTMCEEYEEENKFTMIQIESYFEILRRG